jgi:hypothetical protein
VEVLQVELRRSGVCLLGSTLSIWVSRSTSADDASTYSFCSSVLRSNASQQRISPSLCALSLRRPAFSSFISSMRAFMLAVVSADPVVELARYSSSSCTPRSASSWSSFSAITDSSFSAKSSGTIVMDGAVAGHTLCAVDEAL